MLLTIFSIFLSCLNFYFLFKKLSQKPFDNDLKEFQSQTERIIVEFNRITTRNVELLDSRIEELNHKIRLSQKVEQFLKERFEEATKIECLKPFTLDQVFNTEIKNEQQYDITDSTKAHPQTETSNNKDNLTNENSIDNIQVPKEIDIVEEITINEIIQTNQKSNDSTSDSEGLFEGIPIQKIKKHPKNSPTQYKELLKYYIEQEKSKEELLELGFNQNEINIAMLYHSQEK